MNKSNKIQKYRKPNIAFILCRNDGWGVFSCCGGKTRTSRTQITGNVVLCVKVATGRTRHA